MRASGDEDRIVAAISERIAGYCVELTTGRDANRVRDYYTEGAVVIGPDMQMGASDVAEFMRGLFDTGVEIKVDRQTAELFVHGDVAYELATAEDTLLYADGSEHAIRNNMFIRWEKGSDGLWRFARVLLSPMDAAG